jgi:hypothetical protein
VPGLRLYRELPDQIEICGGKPSCCLSSFLADGQEGRKSLVADLCCFVPIKAGTGISYGKTAALPSFDEIFFDTQSIKSLHRNWHQLESFAASFCALDFIGSVRLITLDDPT